jgi:hypothetical protein
MFIRDVETAVIDVMDVVISCLSSTSTMWRAQCRFSE